jgi:hypothetical protein
LRKRSAPPADLLTRSTFDQQFELTTWILAYLAGRPSRLDELGPGSILPGPSETGQVPVCGRLHGPAACCIRGSIGVQYVGQCGPHGQDQDQDWQDIVVTAHGARAAPGLSQQVVGDLPALPSANEQIAGHLANRCVRGLTSRSLPGQAQRPPPGSKNRRPATRDDVSKTVKRDELKKEVHRQSGTPGRADRSSQRSGAALAVTLCIAYGSPAGKISAYLRLGEDVAAWPGWGAWS